MSEAEIWRRIRDALSGEIIACQKIYEVPLTSLGYLVWGDVDYDDLKGLNRQLAHVLKKRRIKIVRKHGRRYALIPERLLAPRKRKMKLEISEVWRW
ncbi:MAG: hypothetical protein DRN61_06265 [Thaumarchaeota archaeon]|nr:MAG: hypothetical protein DRN61_06265 [Nitrososphaerota archaeon]